MLAKMMRTSAGGRFVQFMRSDRGKAIDKFLVRHLGVSLLMQVFAARVGFPPIPVLMIYTKGRKSGIERATVMPYLEYEGRRYLIGSNGGKPKDPLWVENLRADPAARIVVNRRETVVRGRVVISDCAEYDAVFAYSKTKTPQYQTYQGMMTRKAPIVALEPV